MKRMILIIMSMLLVLVLNLPAQATSGRGQLRGVVLAESTGEPLPGVTVKLYSIRARAYYKPSPTTDKEGKWRVLFVRGGDWHIDFSKPGYETRKISFNVNTQSGAKKPAIEIKLKEMAGPALESGLLKEIEKAAKLYNEEKFSEALVKFNEILGKNKDSSAVELVYKFIGNCYAGLLDYDNAIAAYEKALKKYPTEVDLLVSIGNAYTNSGKAEQALEYFKKVPFEQLVNIDTLYNIGAFYYNNGDYPAALKYFKRAVELNDEFAEGFYQLGMTYLASGENQKALAALKKFMQLAPGSADYQTAKTIVDAYSRGS